MLYFSIYIFSISIDFICISSFNAWFSLISCSFYTSYAPLYIASSFVICIYCILSLASFSICLILSAVSSLILKRSSRVYSNSFYKIYKRTSISDLSCSYSVSQTILKEWRASSWSLLKLSDSNFTLES